MLDAPSLAKLAGAWSRAQPKPETKVLGKEAEAEAQLYGFWQHKKIKEEMLEIFQKARSLRAREVSWNPDCHFPVAQPLTSFLTSLRHRFLRYKTGIIRGRGKN